MECPKWPILVHFLAIFYRFFLLFFVNFTTFFVKFSHFFMFLTHFLTIFVSSKRGKSRCFWYKRHVIYVYHFLDTFFSTCMWFMSLLSRFVHHFIDLFWSLFYRYFSCFLAFFSTFPSLWKHENRQKMGQKSDIFSHFFGIFDHILPVFFGIKRVNYVHVIIDLYGPSIINVFTKT